MKKLFALLCMVGLILIAPACCCKKPRCCEPRKECKRECPKKEKCCTCHRTHCRCKKERKCCPKKECCKKRCCKRVKKAVKEEAPMIQEETPAME